MQYSSFPGAPAEPPPSRTNARQQGITTPGDHPSFLLVLSAFDARFEQFVEHACGVRGHSEATGEAYRCAYRDFRRFLVAEGDRPLIERVFHVEAWVLFNRKRGLSPISINTFWRSLHTFFRDMNERDGVPDPFKGLRQPPIPSHIPKAKSPAECRRIIDAARHYPWPTPYERARAVAVLSIMLYAGLRRGEALSLGFADVDLSQGLIRVLGGKGRGGGKDRTAYIPPELREILREYLRERDRRRLSSVEFFTSQLGGRGMSLAALKRIQVAVQRTSGIRFSFHSLRHSCISAMLRAGVPIHVARDLAGHTDITTTARYLATFDAEKREHVQKIRF